MKIKTLIVILFVIGVLFLLGYHLEHQLFEYYSSISSNLLEFTQEYYIFSVILFIIITLFLVNFPIPLTTVTFLLAGFLYGIFWGSIINTFAVTLGSYFGFKLYNTILKNFAKKHFSEIISKNHFKDNSFYYFFNVRSLGFVPYEHINIASAFIPISTSKFVLSTFLGTLPMSIIFAYFGYYGLNLGDLDFFNILLILFFLINYILIFNFKWIYLKYLAKK